MKLNANISDILAKIKNQQSGKPKQKGSGGTRKGGKSIGGIKNGEKSKGALPGKKSKDTGKGISKGDGVKISDEAKKPESKSRIDSLKGGLLGAFGFGDDDKKADADDRSTAGRILDWQVDTAKKGGSAIWNGLDRVNDAVQSNEYDDGHTLPGRHWDDEDNRLEWVDTGEPSDIYHDTVRGIREIKGWFS